MEIMGYIPQILALPVNKMQEGLYRLLVTGKTPVFVHCSTMSLTTLGTQSNLSASELMIELHQLDFSKPENEIKVCQFNSNLVAWSSHHRPHPARGCGNELPVSAKEILHT